MDRCCSGWEILSGLRFTAQFDHSVVQWNIGSIQIQMGDGDTYSDMDDSSLQLRRE